MDYQNQALARKDIPVSPSEISIELDMLAKSISTLVELRHQLSSRLQPVSRGVPPKTEQTTKGVAAVLSSSVARSIESARHQVDQISDSIQDEISALAV